MAKKQEMELTELYGDLYEILGTDHVDDVKHLMVEVHMLHEAKEAIYDKSFARRGIVGIWMNVARKYDSIDTLGRLNSYFTVTMVDALIDVAVYALKMVEAIRKLRPEVFNEWYEKVYKNYVTETVDE